MSSFAVSVSFSTLLLIAVCLLTHPIVIVSQPSCESFTLPTNKTFDNCQDLPTLNAVLHWTYDPSKSSLSMAYSAPIPEDETVGWVGYGLNPNGTGMVGAQVLVAHKSNASVPVTVATYDVRAYDDIRRGPISYNVTSLSTVEASKVYTIFATWANPLQEGESSFNQIWNVGPMNAAGMSAKHASEPENLSSRMKLSLIDEGPTSAPSPTPATSSASRCESFKLPTNKTFDNCKDLPTLNAMLHWTYDPSKSSMSMAYTAPIPEGETTGWVGYGLNPNGTGMVGAQVLVAHKSNASVPVTVATYDVRAYDDIRRGPISYNVTSLSTVEASKVYTIFATWANPLQKGESSLNQIWNVGPMNAVGMSAKHASEPENLSSRMKLTLIDEGPTSAPSPTPTTSSAPSCESIKLPANKTFDNCKDLPTLNAVLHWTYDPSKSSMSMAYTAPIPEGETTGWVGYGLNPNGTGMVGAQVLVAHKSNASVPVTVATYDVRAYDDIRRGPISYNVTSLSTVEASKVYTIFATWANPLQKGESSFNQIWNVGPMNAVGMSAKHASEPENLSSRMKLTLIDEGPTSAPSPTPTTSSAPSCESIKLPANKTFDNCKDLPTLNAVLHWTYDPSKSSMSMAYTAPIPEGETTGWVGYALNPSGTGMVGAQALVAHKSNASVPVTVATYDVRAYSDIRRGPISYNVTSLSAVESSKVYTIFATWANPLKEGESSVNQIWNVGPMNNAGMSAKHASETENLSSKMKLALIEGGDDDGSPSSTPTTTSAAVASATAPLLLMFAPAAMLLVVYFF